MSGEMTPGEIVERLERRGGMRLTVGGQVYEIRVLLLRHIPGDVTSEERVLSLNDVALLLSADEVMR